MLATRELSTFLNLQQTVLDSKDEKTLLATLLNSAIVELPKIGLTYDYISAVFFDSNQKSVSSYGTSRLKGEDLKIKQDLLGQDQQIKQKLLENKIAISSSLQIFFEKVPSDSKMKSLIFSPIRITEAFIGVLILGSEKDEKNISTEEYELIEIFTNFVALAYRLQDTQTSLTTITQEVYKMNAKLHDLDRLKDDFVSMASHELRTPMTAIKSYLWMALNKKKGELSQDLARYLNRAYLSTERLINLVNDMLNISRIESGRIALTLKEVDLAQLTREVTDEVIPKATELKLNIKVADKKVSNVLCDRDKVHEVILNLIGNSLKFTKAGGTITVSFEEKPPYVFLSVTDTGVGMDKEDLERLFKKFSMGEHSYVAASTSGGSGLGLYISKSIISLHQGEITAYSPGRGKGTTFTFSLPIVNSNTAIALSKIAPKASEETKELEKKSIHFI